jgi:hypothetical protein
LRPSPKPGTPKEEFQPPKLPLFGDELSQILWKYLESIDKTEVHLNFHIFAILGFDLLLGYPF